MKKKRKRLSGEENMRATENINKEKEKFHNATKEKERKKRRQTNKAKKSGGGQKRAKN